MDQGAGAAKLSVASVIARTKAVLGEESREQTCQEKVGDGGTLESAIAAADFALPEGWRDEVRADLAAQLEAGGTLYGCHDDGTLFARTKAGDQVISLSVDSDS